MVECLSRFRAREGLGYHYGGREVAQLLQTDTVRVRYVDHDLAPPILSVLRDFLLRSERNSQNDDVGLDRVLQRLGDDCLPDRLCDRRERFGQPPACYRHFEFFAGERCRERLTDFAGTYSCLSH